MVSDNAPVHTTVRAEFNPLIKPFLVLKIGVVMIATIVGIPLAIVWFLGVGQWWARHYFERLECQLGERSLRYRKGILVTTEKTIPLENIQDVTFIEGPILRRFNLSTLKFETAGHSAGQASDMQLTGIIDAQAFRAEIMRARDALRHAPRSAENDAHLAVLRSIEAKLDDIAGLLRARQ
ncbi:PH domain-containing protein [Massilia sp. BSC265]|uniref:PH domain-containing protein n=1 Tax=Massilia sp. BSC265 TaxID=1549812 RepID=UPI00068CA99F|nr:PH domain-containing protein [Massilia sp. BSC265]